MHTKHRRDPSRQDARPGLARVGSIKICRSAGPSVDGVIVAAIVVKSLGHDCPGPQANNRDPNSLDDCSAKSKACGSAVEARLLCSYARSLSDCAGDGVTDQHRLETWPLGWRGDAGMFRLFSYFSNPALPLPVMETLFDSRAFPEAAGICRTWSPTA
ncbi:hypothetical protein P170DRAFT_140442 [Aspergillus steynii IBT 23096]|uniref:Uncharacterized protein n=1 Tax=Aspergillus steynii IBT 23096 TaxID=1392250 RepID=A0A2I2GBJ5_9EURO|nr:uncharacterized protein P170DRAFT_140442 [Aspergillus steynii IBT 23096]PLB50262.1 hypothetical protein P170DRAFT_140442 [Aspergillus steynii IBT 23096]